VNGPEALLKAKSILDLSRSIDVFEKWPFKPAFRRIEAAIGDLGSRFP
jgi:hypothetical protein